MLHTGTDTGKTGYVFFLLDTKREEFNKGFKSRRIKKKRNREAGE